MFEKIAIIDADLIGRKKHRFPNLACEKISGYWKEQGAEVELKMDYENLDSYDHVFISKVFTDTPVPEGLKDTERIHLGGTGFYFDKAPNLPNEIEHHLPDYHLYDEWIAEQGGGADFREYTDYSIGFITRGCFRKCPFCVNQKYDHVFCHSPIKEFHDPGRKKLCMLDDNILGYPKWREVFAELKALNKPFKFKQGMDERLLTDEKCRTLFSCKYDGDYTFAFDNIKDYDLIESKLKLIRNYTDKRNIKFYVLVGFESTDIQDIENAFKRIELLMRYKCLPYIMRYQNKNETPWKDSEWRGMYIALARWCNQPSMFKNKSFREWCWVDQKTVKTPGKLCAPLRELNRLEAEYPEIAKKYVDLKYKGDE